MVKTSLVVCFSFHFKVRQQINGVSFWWKHISIIERMEMTPLCFFFNMFVETVFTRCVCATFDDGTSKSHCWKINSLFSLILICGQVDLFIFYFHFIVIFILYFYFYFCHRWRWCLFKKELFLVDLFIWKKNATNVLCFWCIRIDSNRHYLYFRWIIFFLAYIVNEKMFASNFQRKTWKSRLWLLIQKNKFCTLSLQAPHVVLQVLFLDNPGVLLGFANDDNDGGGGDDDDHDKWLWSTINFCLKN